MFAATVLLLFAHYSDKLKLRSPFIFVAQCMALIGFTVNITNAPRGPKYFGLFLAVAGAYGAIPGSVTWLGNNLAPTYKRGRFLFWCLRRPNIDCIRVYLSRTMLTGVAG